MHYTQINPGLSQIRVALLLLQALHHHIEWKLFEGKNTSLLLWSNSSVSVAHLNLKRLKDAIVSGWVVISEVERTAGGDRQTEASLRLSKHLRMVHVFLAKSLFGTE